MQITGLPASSAFGSSDVLAIEINGVTYKITGATLAAALQSMGDYLTAQDIANNLTTTDEGYVLDARQGKALLDAIEALGATVEALGDPVEVAHGGTGTGTAPTPGGVIYGASGTAFGSTPAGTAGQFLRSNGANAPGWVTVDKSTIGLGNVDNTSDMDKPVSTAQQAAIDAAEAAMESAIDTVEATLESAVDAVESAVDGKAGAIYEDVSGAVASFADGADGGVVKALVIGIQPAQDGSGDPSPENVRALTGWTGANVVRAGANICNPDLLLGINSEITKDGNTYKFLRNYSYSNFGLIPRMNKNFDQIQVGYGLMHENESNGDRATIKINYTDGTYTRNVSTSSPANTWRNVTITSIANQTISRVCYDYLYSGGPSYIRDLMVNYGAIATPFEPYQGVETPVTWEDVAGTVYGGSVTLNPDGSVDVSACPYYASYSGQALVGPWVSSMDVYAAGVTPTTGAQVVDLGGAQTVYHVPDAWAPPVQTLLGTNNIWADCGPIMALTYPADTKLYIQKINAPTDDDMTADTQIASGQYFIINGNLYRSTTDIPAGDTINPGTNCVLTNLADALNALNT